ncbi:hypothetical protein PTSG_02797 [Salpingoeca rosetta]|uniref:Uncharacterized protein n=1 Tax=Salpingoeca rosetta (strain ATCC 50818 / BSB-021) TaxID=946362 RepID=F2U3C8_SALR5|nr:uncharacterized protein PTSG_02797 [Salpingoeca rosetta]EGD82122.1 hypothetical protein PTSG_02797 [Salpingoeca rosetta]|eukprot:XP_004996305.1 hypothetical protein PTSG_02797 [Salpingoeca rosetta]
MVVASTAKPVQREERLPSMMMTMKEREDRTLSPSVDTTLRHLETTLKEHRVLFATGQLRPRTISSTMIDLSSIQRMMNAFGCNSNGVEERNRGNQHPSKAAHLNQTRHVLPSSRAHNRTPHAHACDALVATNNPAKHY